MYFLASLQLPLHLPHHHPLHPPPAAVQSAHGWVGGWVGGRAGGQAHRQHGHLLRQRKPGLLCPLVTHLWRYRSSACPSACPADGLFQRLNLLRDVLLPTACRADIPIGSQQCMPPRSATTQACGIIVDACGCCCLLEGFLCMLVEGAAKGCPCCCGGGLCCTVGLEGPTHIGNPQPGCCSPCLNTLSSEHTVRLYHNITK